MPKRLAAFFLLLVLAAVPTYAQRSASAGGDTSHAERPNIVILFVDDMGYGDLSSYGHPVIQTPNLDRLAAQGTRFTSFYTAPWCVPSRTQLLTGRYMSRMNFQGSTGAGGGGRLPPKDRTLAEVLKKAGYSTHMLGKWHLGYQKQAWLPTGRGFDTWHGLPYSNDYKKPWVQTDVPLAMYDGTASGGATIVDTSVDQDKLTTGYTRHAVQRIQKESDAERPFLLYLAYDMPHLPIHTAKRFRGQSDGGLYANVVETLDWSAGRIMKALEKQGIANNTIVFFASDNGPWLDPPPRMLQGGNKRWHQGTTGPLRGSKATSFEGGARVPAIIRWPGRVEAGVETSGLASSLDIFVSLVKAADAQLPDYELDGQDLMPWLTGRQAQSPRKRYYYGMDTQLQALREGPWKLRLAPGAPPQLFNVLSDPAERWNRAKDHPERVERMRRMMKKHAAHVSTKVRKAPAKETN